MKKILVALLMVCGAAIIAGVVFLLFIKAPESSYKPCICNLRLIRDAKEGWATVHEKNPGDPVVVSEVNECIEGGTIRVCPDGGTYCYNLVGEDPICTFSTNSLCPLDRHRLGEQRPYDHGREYCYSHLKRRWIRVTEMLTSASSPNDADAP